MHEIDIVKHVIILEYVVVFFIIIFTYLMYGINFYQKRVKFKKIKKLKAYLAKKFLDKQEGYTQKDFAAFPKGFLDLNVILESINSLGIEYKKENHWIELRNAFLLYIAVPLARKKALSSKLTNKLLAAQIFSLQCLKDDEKILLNLFAEEDSIIQMYSLKALISIVSKEAIKIVIDRLSEERGMNQSIFLNILKNSSKEIAKIACEELKNSQDPNRRAICYKILYRSDIEEMNIFPSAKDIYSENMALRFSVIKFLGLCEPKRSLPILLSLLKDPEWQIRVKALRAMENFKKEDMAEKVGKCLTDENWWVRYDAAKLLKKMGENGLLVLKSQKEDKDLFAYEAAQFVLEEEEK